MQAAAKTAGLALFLLTCLNLFNFIDRYILPGVQPLVQKIRRKRRANGRADLRLLYHLYGCGAAYGVAGRPVPRKPLIVAGALIWSFATLLTAHVHSYEMLYFRHAVVGIGRGDVLDFCARAVGRFLSGI